MKPSGVFEGAILRLQVSC